MTENINEVPKEVQSEVVTSADPNILKQQLKNIQWDMRENFVDYCFLLHLFEESGCAEKLGYTNFSDFVQLELDMSPSKAYYCLKIARKAEFLGVTRAELVAAKSSSLVEIFTLDENKDGNTIKELVGQAKDAKVSDIKEQVNKLKEKEGNPSKFITLKVTTEAKEVIDEAIELARKNYGDTIDPDGNEIEVSVSKALELICSSYLQDINNLGAQ